MKKKIISLQHPWLTWHVLRNQKEIYAYTWPWENQRLAILSKYPPNLQEPVYKSAILEDPMDSMSCDMPDLIDVLKEVLFQNYL